MSRSPAVVRSHTAKGRVNVRRASGRAHLYARHDGTERNAIRACKVVADRLDATSKTVDRSPIMMSMMTTCRQIVHVRSFVRPRQFSFALLLVILVTFATNDEPYSQDREHTQRERERERGGGERERERERQQKGQNGKRGTSESHI